MPDFTHPEENVDGPDSDLAPPPLFSANLILFIKIALGTASLIDGAFFHHWLVAIWMLVLAGVIQMAEISAKMDR